MAQLFLTIALSLVLFARKGQSQLSVTWNGTAVTGPVLVYHDEVLQYAVTGRDVYYTPFDGPGHHVLVCRSATQQSVSWHYSDGTIVGTYTSISATSIYQLRRTPFTIARLLHAGGSTSVPPSGLWTCQLDGDVEGTIPVGLYQRGGGNGEILTNNVSLSSSSFLTDPPTFTLAGDTRGGTPTTYTWTRNGAVINANSSYGITIVVKQNDTDAFRDSLYVSRLTVTGKLPGVYEYAVTNNATLPAIVTARLTIEDGGAVTDLMAVQTGLSAVLVTWTAPSPAPPRGYQITVASASIDETVTGTSHTLAISQPGVYTIQVLSLSQHFTSKASVEVTVRALVMNIEVEVVSASSVRVSWDSIDIPEITGYTVHYSQTGNRSEERSITVHNTANSVEIEGLMSNVSYQIEVVAITELDGNVIMGERSMLTVIVVIVFNDAQIPCRSDRNVFISISVVVTFLLTIILYTTIQLVICALWRSHTTCTGKLGINTLEMKTNAAYGPVLATQPSRQGAYDNVDL